MPKSSETTPSFDPQQSQFEDLDVLRDSHGLMAIISRRKSNGVITFGVFKEFERDGKLMRTGFIPEQLLGEAYEQMVRLARRRCKELRDADPRGCH